MLAKYSIELTFGITAILALIASVVAATLPEPQVARKQEIERHLGESIRIVRKSHIILSVLCFSLFLFPVLRVGIFLDPIHGALHGVPVMFMGFAFAAKDLVAAVSAWNAGRLIKWMGKGPILLLLPAISAIAFLIQGVTHGNTKAEGWGLSAPGVWAQAGPLCGQLEFRHFRDDFDSGYFDNLYELDRARVDVSSGRARSKDALLGRSETLSGVYGSMSADLGSFVRASGSYQYLTGDSDPKQQLIAEARLASELLKRVPRLTSARAYYQKNNIGAGRNENGTGEDDFFESTEDTFYGYALGMEMGGDVSVVWETRYLFGRSAEGRLARRKILTVETVFGF